MTSKREAIGMQTTMAICGLVAGVTMNATAQEAAPANPSAVQEPAGKAEQSPGSSGASLADMYGYSDAVAAGGLVFFSGQVGLDEHGKPPADPEQQYRLAFAAVDEVLTKAGLSRSDLVELLTFHTNYPQNMNVFMNAKKEFLNGVKPTWTAIGVAALGQPGTLVEIKATARAR